MIKTFKHKGLRKFFEKGDTRKLPVQNHDKVRTILAALNAATQPGDMDLPGLRFHPLPPHADLYSVWVNGNYRITFLWTAEGPVDVNIEDYH